MEAGLGAALLIGVLAGACGFALFTVLPETWRPARWPVAVVATLLGALNGWYHFGHAAPAAAEVERQLLESRDLGQLARAYKAADPLSFAAYVEQIREAMAEGRRNSDALAQAAVTMQAAAEDRLASRPIEDIAAYYALRRDEFLELRSAHANACRPLFFGEEGMPLVTLSAATGQRRIDIYVHAFQASHEPAPAPMTEAEFQSAMADIRGRTAAIVGEDADLLSRNANAAGRELRACEVIAELYNQMSASPEAARLFAALRVARPQPA